MNIREEKICLWALVIKFINTKNIAVSNALNFAFETAYFYWFKT